MNIKVLSAAVTWVVIASLCAVAQPRGNRGPNVVSPEVKSDRTVTFRLHAPKAQAVSLSAGDIPGMGFQGRALKKGDNDVWEITLGPIEPGTYRYVFNVDGVEVVDPRNSSISESNTRVWSTVYVPGAPFMDPADVPHGSVTRVYYHSKSLGRLRRMHVYTPPGYETNTEKYPVFYLLHGAGDCDDSWTSVGRANFILDNLIAARKAKPMIVVMPAGHTGPFRFDAPPAPGSSNPLGNARFEDDLIHDIMPFIDSRYRVLSGREHRAIAGLSMGGAQTLNTAFRRPKDFAYVGVFSSAILFGRAEEWEKQHEEGLKDEAKKGLKLFWFATGKQDFLLNRTRESVELFRRHGFDPVYQETEGGHTWIVWRQYLNEFAPQLFR
jgi:enterochelin esterase family protein